MFRVTIKGATYSVTFRHVSNRNVAGGIQSGGTVCRIVDEYNPSWFCEGVSHLHARDTMNRSVGRKIALARAFNGTNFTKAERTIFWNEYKKNCRVS